MYLLEQKVKNTDAITLKSYALSESDKIILMYSKELGLIKGVAKGCKKAKSKLRMDLLIANTLLISKGRNLYNICEAKSINTFKDLRKDIDKLMYASYIAELVVAFGIENDVSCKDIYKMLYNALESISESSNKVEILNAVMKFQLKLMQAVGFGIELENCLCCGESLDKVNMYFSPSRGGVVCENCAPKIESSIKLNYKIRDFLKTLLDTDFDKTSEYEEKATEKICTVCFNLLKNYVQIHCSKEIKSVEMLETVCG